MPNKTKEEQETLCEGGAMTAGPPNMGDQGNCCLCFPLKVGIQVLSVLVVIGAVYSAIDAVLILISSNPVFPFLWNVIFTACKVPEILGAIFFLQFLMKDTPETRASLVKGCMLEILGYVCNVGASILYVLLNSNAGFNVVLGAVIGGAIGVLLWFYWVGCCKRLADSV